MWEDVKYRLLTCVKCQMKNPKTNNGKLNNYCKITVGIDMPGYYGTVENFTTWISVWIRDN